MVSRDTAFFLWGAAGAAWMVAASVRYYISKIVAAVDALALDFEDEPFEVCAIGFIAALAIFMATGAVAVFGIPFGPLMWLKNPNCIHRKLVDEDRG